MYNNVGYATTLTTDLLRAWLDIFGSFWDLCLLDIALNIQVPLTLLSQHIVLNLIPRLTLLVRKYGMVEISNIGMLYAPLHCRNVLHLFAVQIYVYLNSNCVLTH